MKVNLFPSSTVTVLSVLIVIILKWHDETSITSTFGFQFHHKRSTRHHFRQQRSTRYKLQQIFALRDSDEFPSKPWWKDSAASPKQLQEIDDIEKQVIASAKARMDVDRILNVLDQKPPKGQNDLSLSDDFKGTTSTWKIASAAAFVASVLSFIASHSFVLSCVAFVAVFLVAIDPIQSDNLAGALARILGRSTLKTVADAEPKIKALARAVITEEAEIIALNEKIRQLEAEVIELRKWKEKREKVDSLYSEYSVKFLRDLSKENNLPVSGSKNDLLLRLLEEGIIERQQMKVMDVISDYELALKRLDDTLDRL